ncbi:unnamed protein product [Nesidiocoris tenuis]|uniref:Uncharacterized protein n=1 Tax=Nesidiocoris tenuis TaxID=355587 RepID=A0A6H5H8N8_9HEMI|nr:unnamed protein product [Nesidiocoris tenuis]
MFAYQAVRTAERRRIRTDGARAPRSETNLASRDDSGCAVPQRSPGCPIGRQSMQGEESQDVRSSSGHAAEVQAGGEPA